MVVPRKPRTHRLPGGVIVTVIPVLGHPVAALLRAAEHAELYLLYGQTFKPTDDLGARVATGPGFYVGISHALQQQIRAGVSLRQWATQLGRLEPELVVLIRRPERPLDPDVQRLVETHLIRTLWLNYTLLNTVSGCPTVAGRISRHHVLFGLSLARRIVHYVRGRVIPGVIGTPTGGTIHEQIVRLVRSRGPMLTTEIVALAPSAGIPLVHHGDPTATVRRDGATRERDSRGATRVRHTRVLASGRTTCLFYPPWMTRSEAVRAWRGRAGRPLPTQRGPAAGSGRDLGAR